MTGTAIKKRKYPMPSYQERLERYEMEKRYIASLKLTSKEYERRLAEVQRRLHI